MYRSFFPQDLFAQLDRLQRELAGGMDYPPSIRGIGRTGFPAINVGKTPSSFEIYAFVPGVDPANLDVQIEKGVLSIAGERKVDLPTKDDKATVHFDERFAGQFRRVIALPDDIDPESVAATYRDGVLHISIKRQAAALPRRIAIQ